MATHPTILAVLVLLEDSCLRIIVVFYGMRLVVSFQFRFISLLILSVSAFAQQRTLAPPEFIAWLPVTDAERALKAPLVEKDAGAEVLIGGPGLWTNSSRITRHFNGSSITMCE